MRIFFSIITLFFTIIIFSGCGGGSSSQSSNSPSPSPSPAPSPSPSPSPSVSWHTPVQVGPANADFGSISYTVSGSALVSYSVLNGSNAVPRYDLYTAFQTSGTTFATPVLVSLGTSQTNKGGGIYASFYHVDANTIWLASESNYNLNIFKSTNGGASWSLNNFYGISDRDPSFNHSKWYNEGSGNLSLLFGYEYFNPVTNSASLISFANLTGGVWDASLTQSNLVKDPVGVIKNGSNWLVPEGGVASTTDNGSTFSHNWGGGGENFYQIGSTVYALGASGVQATSDFGATWTTVNSTDNFYHAKFIGVSGLIVAVKGNESDHLTFRLSTDNGVTWSTAADIGNVLAAGYQYSNVDLALSPSGKIGLVYSIQSYSNTFGPGANGQGVFFTELY